MGESVSKPSYSNDVSFPPGMKLRCVVIFFRHGARTPLTHIDAFDDICYDPNNLSIFPSEMDIPVQVVGLTGEYKPRGPDDSQTLGVRLPGGMRAGELTTLGRHQSFEFGKSIAAKYTRRLGMTMDRFVPGEVYIRAKNIQRTVDTARCVLAGMYSKADFHGTVGSIHVASVDADILKPDKKRTNGAAVLSPKILATSPGYIQLIQKIQRETGDTSVPVDKFKLKQIHDNLASAREHGLPEPHWARKLASDIDRMALASLQIIYSVEPEAAGSTLVQLAGPLLSEVERCLRSSLEDRNSPKLFLYACSDNTLLPMLFALSCFDNRWPGFLSDLVFELYQDQRSLFWVRVVYCKKVRVIGGLGTSLIPYHQFLQVLAPYISRLGGYVTKYYHTRG